MPRSPKPSIRLIAEKTGLSRATVANALNGTPTVAKDTVEKVMRAAEKLGYRRNPMVGALMSALRRSEGTSLQGVLAVVEIGEPDRPDHGPFHRALLAGCEQCAAELGFGLEYFCLEPDDITPERLCTMLKARGIRGMVLLPSWDLPDFSRFDWSWLTGVYADYLAEEPLMNSVCCDHYRTVLDALEKLFEMGYRRPGMIFEKGREERIHMRMSATLNVFQRAHPEVKLIAPRVLDEVTQASVWAWLDEEQPDVVLAHQGNELMDWIRESGRVVPDDIGFCCLNLAKTDRDVAGLDLRPQEIGRCAVEQLIAQVQRQAWGRTRIPTTTTVAGAFLMGPSLRDNAAAS